MIKKSTELSFTDKKIDMIIAGVPGIGKTTLALSAPRPLLIDLDKGISRVEAVYRKDTDVVDTFEELERDLKEVDWSQYDTIVVDTGGKLLELMKSVVIADNPKNGQSDGTLSLKGYGAIKRKYKDFKDKLKSYNKHLITIFHATEVALADNLTGLRIRIEGSTKDDVWDDVDLGGFVEMSGNKRTIGFNNCTRYYAKGTHGVHGVYDIPLLAKGAKNDFLTRLFDNIKNDLNNEVADLNKYQDVMNEFKPKIDAVKDAKGANDLIKELSTIKHYLTSKEELWVLIQAKAKELNLTFNKKTLQYE